MKKEMKNRMSIEEVSEVIASIKDVDMSKLSIADNCEYVLACVEFAEKIKPIIVKAKMAETESTEFLFRL